MTRIKSSSCKIVHPYRKQIFRISDEGVFKEDMVDRADQTPPTGKTAEPLFEPVVRKGRLIRELPELNQIRNRIERQLAQLRAPCKHFHTTEWYPVDFTETLEATLTELRLEHSNKQQKKGRCP